MSTQQVERLTALLARVQRNRSSSRGGNGASAPQPVAAVPAAAPAPKRAEPPVPSAPVPSAPARGRHAPTPLEMALEGRVSQPAEQFTRPMDVAPPPPPAPAPAPARAAAAGRVLAEPITPEPSKPIVQVVSKQPPHAAASFGELLKRSLSLRPR